MDDEARTEEILRLSFRWQHLRDRSELLEHYGHDAGGKRKEMAEIQEKIAILKAEGRKKKRLTAGNFLSLLKAGGAK